MDQQPPQVDGKKRTDRAKTRTWPRMNGFRSECGSEDAPDHSTAQTSGALAAGRARGPAPCSAGPKPCRLGAAEVASRVRKPGIRPPLTQPLRRVSMSQAARLYPTHTFPSRHQRGAPPPSGGGPQAHGGGRLREHRSPQRGRGAEDGGRCHLPAQCLPCIHRKVKEPRARVTARPLDWFRWESSMVTAARMTKAAQPR